MKSDFKERTRLLRMALTDGYEQAQELKLGDDPHNWTPLNYYCYIVGCFAGILCSIATAITIALIYLI